MSQRTARQWLINAVLVIITLSFLGVSIAPLVGSIISSNTPTPTPTADPEQQRQAELKAQLRGYQEVLKKEPKNEFVLKQTVRLQQALGDIKASLEPLQALADNFPDQPQYRYALAATHQQLGDRPAAKKELKKILTTKPGYLDALQALVNLELEDKKPEAAIGAIKEILDSAETANKITPDTVNVADVQWLLGKVYSDQKRYDEAIAAFEAGIKADDKNFRPYLGKAEVKRKQGNEAEAKVLFGKAFELAPLEVKDRIKQLSDQPPAPSVIVEPLPTPPAQ